jgi:arylsulfatase A-like enzyme
MTQKIAGTSPSLAVGKKQETSTMADKQPIVYFILAIWFGLVTGLLEALGQVIGIFYLKRDIRLGHDVVWMAPLANIVLFGIIGLVLLLLARRWPKLINLRTTTFIFCTLSIYTLLSLSDKLADFAKGIFAAGVASQLSYLITRHPAIFYALVGYSIGDLQLFSRSKLPKPIDDSVNTAEMDNVLNRRQVVLSAGVAVAGLALGTSLWKQRSEARALALLPAPPRNMPNALLIVMDTVRAKSMSLYGYSRATTPYLQRFAQRAVTFERAISTAPWTLPSHASVLTGRFPHELFQSRLQPLGDTYPTLAEVLGEHGYQTSGFVANLQVVTHVHGLNRGFSHYEDYPISPGQVMLSTAIGQDISLSSKVQRASGYYESFNRKSAQVINSDFLRWLSRRDPARPFFTFINYFDAHEPYLPPTEFALKFSSKRPRGHHFYGADTLSSQDIRELNDAYDGAISYIDYQLELLLTNLQEQGILDNTLVIITADHGEQFGEHNLLNHGNSVYLQSVHVPLLMSLPSKIPSNHLVGSPISLRDLPATVMQLLELDETSPFPGSSLARNWLAGERDKNMQADAILSEMAHYPEAFPAGSPATRGTLQSLIHSGLHYIVNQGDGREELYDVENDPSSPQDLTTTEIGQQKLELFRSLLARIAADAPTNG